MPAALPGKGRSDRQGDRRMRQGAWGRRRMAEEKMEPTAASLLRASWQTGRPCYARSPPHALGVGQRPLGLASQIPSACQPATGVAGRQDRESCVSPLPACCTKKQRGRQAARAYFWDSPRVRTKMKSLESWPVTARYAGPQREAQRAGTAPPCYTCTIGGGGLTSP